MRLAIFDLDDTLWSREKALRRWAFLVAQLATTSNEPVAVVEIADAGGSKDREDFLNEVHDALRPRVAREAFSQWYDETYPDCFEPFPGVKEALDAWSRRGWRLGVATNGKGSRQRAKLMATGLAPFFDVVVAADEVGVEKPAAALFVEVARRLGCPLDGWVLGDSPTEDMAGAAAAGLHRAWVGDRNSWEGPLPRPDLVDSSVVELMRQIDAWEFDR